MEKWSQHALKVAKYALLKVHILLWPIPLVVLLEFLNRDSISQTVKFIYQHPNEFFLNYLIILGLFLIFVALVGRTQIAFWITTGIVIILGIISGVKFKMLGVPLLPWDIVLTAETADIATNFNDLIPWKLVGGAAVFGIVCGLWMNFVKGFKARFNWKEKVVLAVISIAILFTVYTDKPIKIKSAMGITQIPWNQAENYQWNGFALTSLMNLDLVFIKEPDNYSESTIASITKDVERRTNINPDVNPNVIVILSESLFDATKMENVQFSEDPMPFLRTLQSKYTHGEMFSPQFGGGTANVEFEVLSGNSTRFLPQGSLAYIQYVNHPVDSLASILSRQGYATTAINPFHNWFFNSRNVYRNFGFEKFISQEFFEPENTGNYYSDRAVAETIISETDLSPGPDMVFANTMENHSPYPKNKFGTPTITVKGSGLSQESIDMLESYAGGMRKADNMLKSLTEHYERKGEPTIILFFGDHLPSMGNNMKMYREAKFLNDGDPDFTKKMYSTPFVIWDNYLPEQREQLFVSPSFLGPYVLNMAQKEGTPFTDYLYNFMQKHPVIPPQSMYAQMNLKAEDLLDYQLLQYDSMFGEQYSYNDFKNQFGKNKFVLGHGEMVIDSAKLEKQNGETRIVVRGQNLAPTATIELNGKALATRWDKGILSASLPDSGIDQDTFDIQLKVIDSQKTAIVKSNIMQVDGSVAVSTQ